MLEVDVNLLFLLLNTHSSFVFLPLCPPFPHRAVWHCRIRAFHNCRLQGTQ